MATAKKAIEGILSSVLNGAEVEVPPELLDQFGKNMANAIMNQLTPRPDEQRLPKKTLYASEIGKPCLRSLWYRQRSDMFQGEQLSPATKLKFMYGDLVEELVLFLAEAGGCAVTGQQEVMEIPLKNGWKIRGRKDARIDGLTYDVKSSSSFGMKKFESPQMLRDNDSFGYEKQLNGYTAHDGDTEGAFIAIDKTTGSIRELVLDNLDTLEEVQDYWNERIPMIEADEMPPRSFEDKPDGKSGNMILGTECGYCDFKHHCWKDANDGDGIRTFLYSNKPKFLTNVGKLPKVPEL